MLQRELEPELMDTPEEARDYDQMDHSEVNRRFVDDLLAVLGDVSAVTSVVDLGTGTSLIPIELCQRNEQFRVTAIDAAEHMLHAAQRNVESAGLGGAIELVMSDAKGVHAGQYDVVMSNSLAHHLPSPEVMFDRAIELLRPGGLFFVRDLFRPQHEDQWQHLVDTYAGNEAEHARKMFADSLRAALTVEEVRAMVNDRGFATDTVQATSDRHWTWVARSA
ncbi:class I SAM-dependent methyltransferase [Aeoliella mucimassa]|uniref:8-demethylnovobiocic acid C(8)-methyltransferase n=1 Tax=Aeoliella mucimassa TaxID=2527972 RepID=A0A518AH40_9BACT|nr:class I SAM-dependent methyltransferase [Aeoliella mucimassa]QDU54036.1 8-demethylnovobiocic acid C(8)-methyltransferase [Aeoliella mucimassa]